MLGSDERSSVSFQRSAVKGNEGSAAAIPPGQFDLWRCFTHRDHNAVQNSDPRPAAAAATQASERRSFYRWATRNPITANAVARSSSRLRIGLDSSARRDRPPCRSGTALHLRLVGTGATGTSGSVCLAREAPSFRSALPHRPTGTHMTATKSRRRWLAAQPKISPPRVMASASE